MHFSPPKNHTKLDPHHDKLFQRYHDFIKQPTHVSAQAYEVSLNRLSVNPFEAASSLCRLGDAGIPATQENVVSVVTHASPFDIASAFIQLHDSRLLSAENKKAVQNHPCPGGIALVLRLLHSVTLLTSDNRTAIQLKNDPYEVASVLFKLYDAELFTQKNFDLVLAHTKLDSKINSLREFDRKNRLTPSLFKQLFTEQEKKPLKNGYTERSTIQTTPIHYLACGPANFFSKKQPNDQLTQANAGYKHHNKQMCKQ